MHLKRRSFLAGISAASAYWATPLSTFANDDSLSARAKRRGLTFGCELVVGDLVHRPLRDAILRDAGMVVPGIEMKWRETQKTSLPPNYSMAERIATFAADNRLALRGHTIIWHQNPPVWARPALEMAEGRKILLNYTTNIVSHFRNRVVEWDVVNEAIETKDNLPGGLRNWYPYQQDGYQFIADCFQAAHNADPNAILCYNDFGLEYKEQYEKRDAVLKLLRALLDRKAPIHCLGIQSHLVAGWNFDEKIFRTFLAEVASLGLKIRLTEFEVDDKNLAPEIEKRDQGVADAARRYLNAAFDEKAVAGLLTWGLSDYTYRSSPTWYSREDKLAPRRLPLDENFQRKPFWYAIADSFDNAPVR